MKRFSAGLLAGLLVLLTAGCQDDPPAPDNDGLIDYVALGDSYTAAPGVPATDPADPCFRSDSNYPNLVAEEKPNIQLTDVSCSGATTDAMTKERSADIPPQFDALSEDTDLVTIGIGGNDGGVFLGWAQPCQDVAVTDPEGSPCADTNETADGDVLLDRVEPLEKTLTKVIEGAQDRAPNARVIMVTYPQILPDEGSCPDLVGYAAGDYAYINSIISAQNDAIVGAAKETGVEWVDVEKASRGHDICAKKPWVNGTLTNDWSRGNPLHPFPEEQAAVAQLILELL